MDKSGEENLHQLRAAIAAPDLPGERGQPGGVR